MPTMDDDDDDDDNDDDAILTCARNLTVKPA